MFFSIVITGGVTCVLLRAMSSATYSYNLAGEMTELVRENGVRTVTGYDLAGRQTGVTHQIGLSVLDGVGYGMDSMGRRTSITRPGGQNDSYGYDAAGQVTAGSYLATPSGNQSDGFAYDAMGNRTSSARNGVNVSYSANALEQYSAVGGAVPIYDAGGNALSLPVPGGATVEMTWDAENRMLSSTRNGAAVGATVLPLASSLVNGARVVNRYDVLHRRVVKEVHAPNGSGGWTLQERRLFTYDGWNVIEERAFDAGGSLVAWQRLTWGRDASGRLQGAGGVGGLLLAEELPVSGVGSAVGHYPGYDGNWNMVLMTTGSGVVEGRWRYGAFGGTLGSVTASGGYAERQPWRFSGKYLDGEVETRGGVYYYGFRHYLPEVGRWASRDPIGESGGVNLYGMVANRVVNRWDRLGLIDSMGNDSPDFTNLPPPAVEEKCNKGQMKEISMETLPYTAGTDPETKEAQEMAEEIAERLGNFSGVGSAVTNVDEIFAGTMELFGSTGYMFEVDVKITFKCCICDEESKKVKWGESQDLSSQVDSPFDGLWSVQNIQGITQAILKEQDYLRQLAKSKCEN
jgi:RHS repeat-associated protein